MIVLGYYLSVCGINGMNLQLDRGLFSPGLCISKYRYKKYLTITNEFELN
jgi:hypothetical protein